MCEACLLVKLSYDSGMRNLLAAAALVTMAGCGDQSEDTKQDPQLGWDPTEFCAEYEPETETALKLQESVGDDVGEALDYVDVGLGVADDPTLDRVRSKLMARMLEAGYVLGTDPIDPTKAHRVEEASCYNNTDHSYCKGSMYLPDEPGHYGYGLDVEKTVEHRSDKDIHAVLAVAGKTWKPHFPAPKPVEIAVQCGTVTFAGDDVETDYIPTEGGESKKVETRTPVTQGQVFCTYDVTVGGEPTYFHGDRGTVVYTTDQRDGKPDEETVTLPHDSFHGYADPGLAQDVSLQHTLGKSDQEWIQVHAANDKGRIYTAWTCETDQVKGWMAKIAGKFQGIKKFLGLK